MTDDFLTELNELDQQEILAKLKDDHRALKQINRKREMLPIPKDFGKQWWKEWRRQNGLDEEWDCAD